MQNLNIVKNKICKNSKNIFLVHQVHSNKFIFLNKYPKNYKRIKADAIITNVQKLPIAVLTADCVPVLLYNSKKKMVAAIHAGWKGAYKGIIPKVINFMEKKGCERNVITAAIGPCISTPSLRKLLVTPEFPAIFMLLAILIWFEIATFPPIKQFFPIVVEPATPVHPAITVFIPILTL